MTQVSTVADGGSVGVGRVFALPCYCVCYLDLGEL